MSKAFGVIQSPNYPASYDGPKDGNASKTCNWYLTVRPRHKILLNFESFAVEGEPSGEHRGVRFERYSATPGVETIPEFRPPPPLF